MGVMNKNTEVAPSYSEQWGLEWLGNLWKDGRAWKGHYMKGRLVERILLSAWKRHLIDLNGGRFLKPKVTQGIWNFPSKQQALKGEE